MSKKQQPEYPDFPVQPDPYAFSPVQFGLGRRRRRRDRFDSPEDIARLLLPFVVPYRPYYPPYYAPTPYYPPYYAPYSPFYSPYGYGYGYGYRQVSGDAEGEFGDTQD